MFPRREQSHTNPPYCRGSAPVLPDLPVKPDLNEQ